MNELWNRNRGYRLTKGDEEFVGTIDEVCDFLDCKTDTFYNAKKRKGVFKGWTIEKMKITYRLYEMKGVYSNVTEIAKVLQTAPSNIYNAMKNNSCVIDGQYYVMAIGHKELSIEKKIEGLKIQYDKQLQEENQKLLKDQNNEKQKYLEHSIRLLNDLMAYGDEMYD